MVVVGVKTTEGMDEGRDGGKDGWSEGMLARRCWK